MDFLSAINIISSPWSESTSKSNAIAFLEATKQSADGWIQCLPLCFEQDPEKSQVTLFAYQVMEYTLKHTFASLSPQCQLQIKQSLWQFFSQTLSPDAPTFVKNKLALLITLLYKNLFTTWTSFFSDLIQLTKQNNLPEKNRLMTDMLLRICTSIDEEVVCRLIHRTQSEMDYNAHIKDAMRLQSVKQLVNFWFDILQTFTDPHTTNVDHVNGSLVLIAHYTSWIDIHLLLSPLFFQTLHATVKMSVYRHAAVECLTEIIGKGMRSSDKIQLLVMFNIMDLIRSLDISDDETFKEHVAKLINSVGVELVKCWESSVDGTESTSPVQTLLLQPIDIPNASFQLLNDIFPLVLLLLGDQYDDTTSLLFPFVSVYISLLKKYKKMNGGSLGVLEASPPALMTTLVQKMKVDEEEEETHDQEDILFTETRLALKSYVYTLAQVVPDVFTSLISSIVYSTFDTYQVSALTQHHLPWSEVELALYLLFGYSEACFGTSSYIQPTGELTVLGELLKRLMTSNISMYQHDAIQLLYFEILHRYWGFFEIQAMHLPEALESFVDHRGLHHPKKSIRSRVNYLFLRFIKMLKMKLGAYAKTVLMSIQDLLVIEQQSPTAQPNTQENYSFDSIQYLYEAVGVLISSDGLTPAEQENVLSSITSPILTQIQQDMSQHDTAHLCSLIASIGSISKGFPDYETVRKKPLQCLMIFGRMIQGIIGILEGMRACASVRDAVRFTFQRMVGCMGPDALMYLNALMNAGLFTQESTSKELVEFMNFLGLVLFKYKKNVYDVVDAIFIPVLEKTFMFLNQTPQGTDDSLASIELRKAYLAFLACLFTSELEQVYTSPRNSERLSTILQSVLHYIQDTSDTYSQKLACTALMKMILHWGGVSVDYIAQGNTKAKKGNVGVNTLVPKECVPGFDTYIYETVVPLLMSLSREKSALNIISELASLHKTILISQGKRYRSFLKDIYLPRIMPEGQGIDAFVDAVEKLDAKGLKKFLKDVHAKQS